MFLNLSHHPSALWPAVQTEAARQLGGSVQDHAFPEVLPEASSADVAALGASLLTAILVNRPAGAMVQGEYVLSFFLVRGLEAAGIPCYAATAKRVIERRTRDDGTVEQLSQFEFVQFRRYCGLD